MAGLTMLSLLPYQNFTCRSSNQYSSNAESQILNVQGGDVIDLLAAGCLAEPSDEVISRLPMAHGRFYVGNPGDTMVAILTITATLYAHPIFIGSPITIATFNVGVTTGQTGGAAHYGIYADNNGYPSALIYDTGAIAGLTSTTVVTNTPTTPPTLAPGWYWIASIFTASSTFPSVTGLSAVYTGSLNGNLGSDTAAHALTVSALAATGISVAGTYGALPLQFPAGATITENAATPTVCLGV